MVDRPEDWTTDSQSALSIYLFDELESQEHTTTLAPRWTYALFGDTQQIFGYKKLRIRLTCHACTLQALLQVDFQAKIEPSLGVDAENVEEVLLENLAEDTVVCINGIVTSPGPRRGEKLDSEDWMRSTEAIRQSCETPIHSYKLGGDTFAIYKLAMPDSQDRVSRMQIFSLLYIEGASLIDVEDDRFDVFVVYESREGQPVRFIGYCTCYRYYFYDKATSSFDAVRYRISQFLILPHYQKKGHGGILYDAIFASCIADEKILEVTVEDPSEAFDDLRDRRDFLRLLREGVLEDLDANKSIPPKAAIASASRKTKIAPAQFRRMLELFLLRQTSAPSKGKQPASQSFARQLRLFVKRRIYRKNAGILKELEAGERKRKLAETYTAQVADYQRILNSMKLESVTGAKSRIVEDRQRHDTAEPASKRVRLEEETAT